MLELEKSSSVVKSLTDLRAMINVVCAFEKTRQSDAKGEENGKHWCAHLTLVDMTGGGEGKKKFDFTDKKN